MYSNLRSRTKQPPVASSGISPNIKSATGMILSRFQLIAGLMGVDRLASETSIELLKAPGLVKSLNSHGSNLAQIRFLASTGVKFRSDDVFSHHTGEEVNDTKVRLLDLIKPRRRPLCVVKYNPKSGTVFRYPARDIQKIR